MAYQQPYYNGGYFPQYQNGAVPDMLNQYKGQYQQPIMQQPMVQQMQAPTQTNDMIWVLNENEATSYPVAPNNSVVLWDKNEPIIYVKSVNNQGMPSMRVLYFEERNATPSNSPKNTPKTHECNCGDKFITKEEFNALKGKFYDLQAKYDKLTSQQEEKPIEKPKTTTKKAKESEE
jgi:hypothetical protein